MTGFWLALGFLTILPTPQRKYPDYDLSRAAEWFVVVGLIVGALLVLAVRLLSVVLPPLLVAVLATGLWAGLTGGLHLDGVADCGDGLLTATTPHRRLEIMRDPRTGAFGVLALVLVVLLKTAALQAYATGTAPLTILWLAPIIARWLLLFAGRMPSARPDGLGAAFANSWRMSQVWRPTIAVGVAVGLGGWRSGLALALALLAALGVWYVAQRRLGGLTGDVLGLTVETAEIAMLIGGLAGLA